MVVPGRVGMVVVRVRLAEVRVVHGVVGQRRAVVGHPAVAHHDRAVDQAGQRAELVGDQHDRGAALLEPAQRRGEGELVGQVDAGGGLVEEEQLRLAGQRPRDQGPLLLAAGELGDAVAGPRGQPDHRDRLVDRGAGRPARAAGAAGGG